MRIATSYERVRIMVDFSKLLTPEQKARAEQRRKEEEAAILGRGTLTAIRYNVIRKYGDHTFEDGFEQELEYELRKNEVSGQVWLFLKKGPTGFESMLFNDIPMVIVRQVPWAANFGSYNYAKLDVPWESLREVWSAHPDLQERNCYKHGKELCDCRPSRCCSKFTHGHSDMEHRGFDPDFNGA